ncbi:protein phosphatase 2C 29-like [Nicotiana sylvestris]|uniref:Protein phosphatase 2C 29-like n=2 Tax=lamiids TaxID=91888 RepID=A0A1U7W2M3_NICSY|nr:PREDICTED: protein phosphatase 2C 29-like [Nicotiana sylvestris]
MGGGFSCFTNPAVVNRTEPEVIFTGSEPLDETLGHSFCYVRSSARFALSPTNSDRFISPSQSLRFDNEAAPLRTETGFRAISGASVSANTCTPRSVLQLDNIYDDGTGSVVNGFESTSSFSALPLQPVPRTGLSNEPAGTMERERAFFMSGPIERGALSGPLDSAVPFSAPLGGDGIYVKKRKLKGINGIKKAFRRPWVVPVRNYFTGKKEINCTRDYNGWHLRNNVNVEWALGKAGEDRVHVVVCEEHGWLFVGIYDGFNGPDAPEFLMSNLYKAMNKELEGLFWDSEDTSISNNNQESKKNANIENEVIIEDSNEANSNRVNKEMSSGGRGVEEAENEVNLDQMDKRCEKKVIFQSENANIENEVIGEESNKPHWNRGPKAISRGARGVEEGENEVNLEQLDKGSENEVIIEVSNKPNSNRAAKSTSRGERGVEEGENEVNLEQLDKGSENEAIGEDSNKPDSNRAPDATSRGDKGVEEGENEVNLEQMDRGSEKRVTFQSGEIEVRRRRLWEFLAEDETEDGLDLSGSERFAFSVDDALSVNSAGSAVNRRSLLLSKLKHGLSINKHKESNRLFPWRFGLQAKKKVEVGENRVEERIDRSERKRKVGPIDHELVLRAMSRALEITELAYLDMTDKVLDRYPELALMGSCLLVALMRDEDVYVMNVGDSRAIVAQYESEVVSSSSESVVPGNCELAVEGIAEEPVVPGDEENKATNEIPIQAMKLTALQLSTDHSTSIEEEVIRIKNEHPDDCNCIVNDRVKGRLKVTRAFGAGFLKKPKLNDALLEMFRNEYIGDAPYLSCKPSLRHHRLCPKDQFLVLSSDGLYQYLSNQEVVCHVENFMEKFPDGDPAQHLIEELLFRAAKKAGMDFHELLDIPQGDRRKYHDDVTVMVVSLEGRIWKSSGKYL